MTYTRDDRIVPDSTDRPLESESAIWTLANGLTFVRILLVAPFVLFIASGRLLEALCVFFIASVTDWADGYLARKFDQHSRLGQLLDPVADKLLAASGFVMLAVPRPGIQSMPLWFVVIVIGRDALILIGVVIVYALTRYTGFKPTFAGKVNTVLELGLIVVFLLFNTIGLIIPLLYWVYLLVAGSVAISGAQYLLQGARILRDFRQRKPATVVAKG